MRRIDAMVCLIAAGMLTGCDTRDASHPPTIRFGEEACASCRMIISDDRYAAALVRRGGDALKFDDVGCLVKHEADGLRPEVKYWVRDSQSGSWLNARQAMFVHSPRVVSPMGFGLAACPVSVAGAEPIAGPDARILRFDELHGLLAEPAFGSGSDRPMAGSEEGAARPPATDDSRGEQSFGRSSPSGS